MSRPEPPREPSPPYASPPAGTDLYARAARPPHEAPADGPGSAQGVPRPPVGVPGPAGSRYGWFVGVVGILILVLITLNTLSTKSNGAAGVVPGQPAPPFAVPLALGRLSGDADVATHANDGAAGRVAACQLRGPQILNVCALYQRGPVALALFVPSGACSAVVGDLQRLATSFPGVQLAAVAIRGSRAQLRTLVRARRWTLPVGYDRDGVLANLYKVSTCPQVTFLARGGRVAQAALLTRPPLSTLRARLAALARAAVPAPSPRP